MSNIILGKNVLVTAKVGNNDVMVGCAESVQFALSNSFVELVNVDGYASFKPQKKAITGSIDGLFTIKSNAIDSPSMINVLDSGRMLSMKFALDTAIYSVNFYVEKVTASSQYSDKITASFSFIGVGGFTINPLIILIVGDTSTVVLDFDSITSGKYKVGSTYTEFVTKHFEESVETVGLINELQVNKPYTLNKLQMNNGSISSVTFSEKLPLFMYYLAMYNNDLTSLDTTKLHPYFTYVDLSVNALDEDTVSNILILLNSANSNDGLVSLNGGTNAHPNTSGMAAKSALESRGWTVEIN